MRLADLIDGLEILSMKGEIGRQITGICYNSGKAAENSVFVAIEGLKQDGHKYIKDALSRGAKVLVVSKDTKDTAGLEDRINTGDITILKVKDTRAALSRLSARYFGNPSEKMRLIGITGTNGKTTTAYLVKSILDAAESYAGLIGSLGVFMDGRWVDSTHTTPESLELQGIFRRMVDKRTDTCVMEVSSHALELERVKDCKFDIGIFTNLTHEHLDFHKSMEHYYEAKRKLFYMASRYNIVNIGDYYGQRLARDVASSDTAGAALLTYGMSSRADIYASDTTAREFNSEFQLNAPNGSTRLKIRLPGEYNIYNCLAAAACGYALGYSISRIKMGLEQVQHIPGRFEVIPADRNVNIIIDYAHTPDGFRQLLRTVSRLAKGRIVMVFGCVGERDHSKRSVMGEIAADYSDLCILTTDNCRSEDPQEILDEVKKGFNISTNYVEILDRAQAIRHAILNSRENDTILITGKGHEHIQIIGNQVLYFNEREIVKRALDDLSRRLYTLQGKGSYRLPF